MTRVKAIQILNGMFDSYLIMEKVCSAAIGEFDDKQLIRYRLDEITDKKIAILTAIDALEQNNGWISVKDRLPEPKAMVLAHCTNGRMLTVGYFDKDLDFLKSGRVTHWMPLPEPPESAEITGGK